MLLLGILMVRLNLMRPRTHDNGSSSISEVKSYTFQLRFKSRHDGEGDHRNLIFLPSLVSAPHSCYEC